MTTYEQAGVSRQGAEDHVAAISASVTSTWGDRVVGGFGGFAAGVEVPAGYRSPVLMMTTDGVGTKLELARITGRWEGVGFDLVAMCLDDLAAVGARPLGLVDYMAVGALHPERDRVIVDSIARACREAGCPLLGGETAEHPGVMDQEAVDLAGAAVGVVERGEELGPHRVSAGDLVIGLASPNLRSNGFSLVRAVLGGRVEELADLLLQPSAVYTPAVMASISTGGVRAGAHVTGGGLPGNLPRALPDGLGAVIDTGSWDPPELFGLIAEQGVSPEEMYATFNMGIGFCLVVEAASRDRVIQAAAAHQPRVIGEVRPGQGVTLT